MATQRYLTSDFEHELTEEQKNIIHRYLVSLNNSYIEKDVFYCTKCNRSIPVDNKLKRAIKKSKVCPKCGNENDRIGIKKIAKYTKIEVGIQVGKMVYGYFCELYNGFDLMDSVLVYVRNLDEQYGYKRYVGINGMSWGGYYWTGRKEWKKTKSQTYYYVLSDYKKLEKDVSWFNSTLKQRYLSHPLVNELKPNQKYLIRKNVLNQLQINYIVVFDLKSIEELYKYSKYINTHVLGPGTINSRKNIHVLEYLSKYNIPFHDYLDYLEECSILHIHNPYPKNFDEVHGKLSSRVRQLKEEEKNRRYDELINQRLVNLNKYSYQDKKYIIEPYKNTNELYEEGRNLSICIAGYCERYAEGKTDLFKVRDINNPTKPFVALELRDNRIIQQRANRNSDPIDEVKKFTKKWLKTVVTNREPNLEV